MADKRQTVREQVDDVSFQMRMCPRTWVRIGLIVLALGLWLSDVGSVSAEPSAECRDLAARFANGAAGLDLGALADLMACVSAEMQGRTGAPTAMPPPVSVAPPPVPPPTGERDQWPQSAPWGSPWPSEGPGIR